MVVKSYNFQVDLIDKIPTIPITLIQGDVNSNIFNISVTESGSIVDLTGSTVTITMQKPDNTIVVGNCTVINPTSGQIQYVCGTNDIAVLGSVIFTISIYNNGAKVTSTQGKFKVAGELDNGSGAQSTTSYSVLDTLITNVNNNENVWQANEATRQNQETTRQTNETTRQAQETARQTTFNTNETARTNTFNTNEAVRTLNENNRVSTFNTDETNRQNTFNTNETNRQNTYLAVETQREASYNTLMSFFNSLQSINRVPYMLDGGWLGQSNGTGLTIDGGTM